MNFEFMPELDMAVRTRWRSAMAGASTLIYRKLKKSGWL